MKYRHKKGKNGPDFLASVENTAKRHMAGKECIYEDAHYKTLDSSKKRLY